MWYLSLYPEVASLREYSPLSLSVARTVSKAQPQGLQWQHEATPGSLLLGIGGGGEITKKSLIETLGEIHSEKLESL